MLINEVKKERQLEGVDRWVKAGCHGIFAWGTGVGKTFGALLAVEYVERKRKVTYLIVLPSKPVLEQWRSMFSSFLAEETMDRVVFKTVHELQNMDTILVVDVFIVDEIHEYTTDDKIKFLTKERVEYKAFLGLTASISDYSFKKILKYVPIVDEITEKEAKERNFIAQFHEFNLQVELTNDEAIEYGRVTEIIDLQMPKFDNNFDIAQKCLVGGISYKGKAKPKYYTAIQWCTTYAMSKGWAEDLDFSLAHNSRINELWHPRKIIGYARLLVTAIRARKNLLEHSYNKYLISIEIIKKFNRVKTIVFSENTDMVDRLFDDLKGSEKVVKYHSNIETIVEPSRKTGKMMKKGKDRQKAEAIEDFKSSKARVMLSTRALDRGLNVPDVRLGLTISGTSKATQYEQRGGRVKRSEDEDSSLFGDTTALLINLYIKDTQDERWLVSRQRNVEHFIYDVTSVDDISYTPPPNEEFIVDF